MTGKTITALMLATLMSVPATAPVRAQSFVDMDDSVPAAGSEAEKLEAVRKKIQSGSLGFFEYVRDLNDSHSEDAARAIQVIQDEKLKEYTSFNDSRDAISLDQMQATFDMLERFNEIRTDNDLKPLKVSLYLTAVAQKQLNYSDTSLTHALAFNPSGENLAWGKEDPFVDWYEKEKTIFEKYQEAGLDADQIYSNHRGEVSHYLEIVDARYHTTGMAHNAYSAFGESTDAWNQVFGLAEGGYPVAEYISLFKSYCQKLQLELEDVSIPMHRLYNYGSGEHFYTASEEEFKKLVKEGWKDEEIGWYAPKSSDAPVYRLYNPNDGDHHYTRDVNERDTLVKVGWNDEGIGWYSADDKGTPLYRQFNPNARTGTHNYTTSKEENDKLVKLGWNAEDIGWYGLKLID